MLPVACVTLLATTLLLWSPALPGSPTAVAAIGAGIVALLCCRGAVRAATLVLVFAVLVWATVWSSASVRADRWPVSAAAGSVQVTGSVCEFARQQPGSWRFLLDSDAESRARGVPARVLVTWYESAKRPAVAPAPGQRWQLELRLRSPRGLSNPGGFDFERWLFSQRIGATGWVREAGRNERLTANSGACAAGDLRALLADRISTALEGRAAAPYVLGLSVGAYQALPESEWVKLRRTGTIHLISISGFHIALVAGPAAGVGLVLGWGLLRLGWRCRPRVIAAWTTVLVASLYGLLAGFSVPTARSILALAVLAVLLTARRVVTGEDLCAATLLAVLLVEPLAPLVPGFWLSFAGVVVLTGVGAASRFDQLAPPTGRTTTGTVANAVAWFRVHAWRPVRTLLQIQLAMTIGLAPLLVWFFGQLPASGALANLVAVPVFSLLLLPLTLLGAAAAAVIPEHAAGVLHLAADSVDLWRQFLTWCAEFPLAVWYLPEPGALAIALALAGAILALWPRPLPGRALAIAMLAGLSGTGSAAVPVGGWRAIVLDVGQGLAVVVQTAGHTLLYDAGPAFRNSDAGQRVVVPALQALGVRDLDTLLISHADADHRGGAESVLERYPGADLLGVGVPRHPATPCQAGQRWVWDGVEFAILHPDPRTVPVNDNASSCLLRISGPGGRLLLPGDLEAPEERELVARGLPGPADLILAPHHGSRSSSSAELVQNTRPHFVVFATGFANRWGFPSPAVAARWHAAGACLLNTADEGALQFDAIPGHGLRLTRRQRASSPGLWLARPAQTPCT